MDEEEPVERTLIQQYATGIVKGLIEQVRSIAGLEHRLTKGRFRELFVTNILDKYLTAQYGVGSGIIINQKGEQSNETDIIIYDNRILPPFIREAGIGVFPIEAGVAVIEVKSNITKESLLDAEEAARKIRDVIAGPGGSIYSPEDLPEPPGCTLVGFSDGGVKNLMEEDTGKAWLSSNIECLWSICLVGQFSWLKLKPNEWSLKKADEFAEETKRYIAAMLDNLRTQSERNYRRLSGEHKDWLGVYTRDNPAISGYFASRDDGE